MNALSTPDARIPMSFKVGCRAAALAVVSLTTIGAVGAGADTTAVADASAQNVTAYAKTAAWSRKAADGYHLVVAQGAVVADAPVPPSSKPYDPDLGPSKTGGYTIVYARRGDLYRYDVGAAAERKLTALSSSATEAAPSYFKDKIVFSRTTGKHRGTYLARPGHKLVRIFRTVAAETDVSSSRIIGRYGKGRKSIIRLLNMNARSVQILARAKRGQRMSSPTLTRYNAIWLRVGATRSTVERTYARGAHRTIVITKASRSLPGRVDSLASFKIPVLYTSQTGVQRIAPKLRFR